MMEGGATYRWKDLKDDGYHSNSFLCGKETQTLKNVN